MDYEKELQLRDCLARNLRYLRISRSPCLSQKMLAKNACRPPMCLWRWRGNSG